LGLLGVDVGAAAEPADEPAVLVPGRQGLAEEPAVVAAAILEAVFRLVGQPGLHGRVPRVEGGLPVLRVQDRVPTRVAVLPARVAGELVPALVEVVDSAVRAGGPDDLRHGVGELPESAVALAEFF